MSQWSFYPKIRFLAQKMWPVARVQRHTQTDRQTRKWKQRAPFQGFRSFPFNLSSMIGPICYYKYRLITQLLLYGWPWSEWNLYNEKKIKTSTTPSCSGPIPAKRLRANSVPRAVFSHQMLKMDFYYFNRFSHMPCFYQ